MAVPGYPASFVASSCELINCFGVHLILKLGLDVSPPIVNLM